jgi:ferric-dicitrate binding protein FerR (iron transport regulator)
MYLLISGNRNGARRQVLTLSVDPNAAFALNVLDPNSGAGGEYAAITLAKGSQIELLTDSDVILSGSGVGQVVGVTVGQIFLSNQ